MSAVVGELADATPAIVTSVVSPAWAAIHPDALRRVLRNLVINAEVHGCPPIVVEVDLEDDRVTLVVWDCGPGMPAGFEDGAFEPFTRAPAAGGRPGAGLGLAIVATIVERYGGICSVRRDQGRFGVQIDVPAVSGPDGVGGQVLRRKAVTGSGKPLTATGPRGSTSPSVATAAAASDRSTSPGSARVTRRAARFTTEP